MKPENDNHLESWQAQAQFMGKIFESFGLSAPSALKPLPNDAMRGYKTPSAATLESEGV